MTEANILQKTDRLTLPFCNNSQPLSGDRLSSCWIVISKWDLAISAANISHTLYILKFNKSILALSFKITALLFWSQYRSPGADLCIFHETARKSIPLSATLPRINHQAYDTHQKSAVCIGLRTHCLHSTIQWKLTYSKFVIIQSAIFVSNASLILLPPSNFFKADTNTSYGK
jgi:hypothetical protein